MRLRRRHLRPISRRLGALGRWFISDYEHRRPRHQAPKLPLTHSLIPDGTIQAAQFIRTPSYVQVAGWWDGTKLNIPHGDNGGELDPHGATGEGNPVGGNVTTNIQGKQGDTFYEEWMMFISYDQFCARICTAEVNGVPVRKQCDHIYDLMGCQWVMAIDEDDYYNMNKFESCEGDIAAPPGVYGGSTWYQGQNPTPSAPAFYPKKSNCHTWDTIANGVGGDMKVTASPTLFQNQKCPTGK